MSTRQKKPNPFLSLIVPALCLAVLGYFIYHAQNGIYAYDTKTRMDKQARQLERELDELRRHKHELQNRVAMLTDGTIEKDQLDELVRMVLGHSGPDEIIILTRDQK